MYQGGRAIYYLVYQSFLMIKPIMIFSAHVFFELPRYTEKCPKVLIGGGPKNRAFIIPLQSLIMIFFFRFQKRIANQIAPTDPSSQSVASRVA